MKDSKLQFSLGFIALGQVLSETCKALKQNFNLSENEIRILLVVYDEKPESIKQISKRLTLSPTLTSKVLSSLEKKNLIFRQLNPLNKRFEQVLLTEGGIRVTCIIIEFIQEFLCEKIVKTMIVKPEDILSFSKTLKSKIALNKLSLTEMSNN
ncbi:MAG: MarR family transcriptional regulator [Ignavibacterium sp.]|uniref:MarR family transcriptional regulator n=1 Tax=Ignavibacterium sp. TaxID=2651167 RepID=UPI0032989CE4